MAIMKRLTQLGLLTSAVRMIQRQARKPGSRANNASTALNGAVRKLGNRTRTTTTP
jgi:hypothetical protein